MHSFINRKKSYPAAPANNDTTAVLIFYLVGANHVTCFYTFSTVLETLHMTDLHHFNYCL